MYVNNTYNLVYQMTEEHDILADQKQLFSRCWRMHPTLRLLAKHNKTERRAYSKAKGASKKNMTQEGQSIASTTAT